MVPQMAGMGAPPVTMNWSDIHWWSVASGWARIMLSRSNLGRGGSGGGGEGLVTTGGRAPKVLISH